MKFKYSDFSDNGLLNYGVFYPENFENLPLLIYLHGAGERGGNYKNVYRHGVAQLLNEGKEIPAVCLIPQCPIEFVWDNIVANLKTVIDTVIDEFNINPDRIVLTGSSMGGYGTYSMGLTYSGFFAGIAPVAGGGMAWRTRNLKTTPVYAIHGDADDVVVPEYSRLMVEGINREGGNAKLLMLEGLGHNDGIDYAYYNTDLLEWLLSCRRSDFTPMPEVCSEFF